ncbi:unnamed protein product, partial [Effrenium voratum]
VNEADQQEWPEAEGQEGNLGFLCALGDGCSAGSARTQLPKELDYSKHDKADDDGGPAVPMSGRMPNRLRSPLPRRRSESLTKARTPLQEDMQKEVVKYVPPHRRQQTAEGKASSSKHAPEPYKVSVASRSIFLGELQSQKLEELEKLRLELDKAEDEEAGQKGSGKDKHSSRQEADKKALGGRVAYLKEKLARHLEWHQRFDKPGAGKKLRVFPLAEGELRDEADRAPPPSERKVTMQKKKAKRLRESAPGTVVGKDSKWTRVDFVIDSGASATTIPKGLVGDAKLGDPVGYHKFKLANGSTVPNEGTLRCKAWLMGDEVVEVRMSVARISQPLLSVGQVVAQGNKVVLAPKISYLETAGGKVHSIFKKNGIYVLPLWLSTEKVSVAACPFEGQGCESHAAPLEGEAGGVSPEAEEAPLAADAEEGRAARPLKAPILPSPEEIEAHAVSHIPFRSWCSHCVRGRGKSYSHRQRDHLTDKGAVPVVSIDYGFFGSPGELPEQAVGGAKMPVLVVRDRDSKALFTHLVPSKGVEHYYPEQALCRDIEFLGYPSVVIKSDQEPAIKAVADAVKNAFAQSNVRVQLENTPKGDHHGKPNGEAEAAVEITQGLCRTYKDACEKGLGMAMDPNSPLMAWLIEHAGNMYTLHAHDEALRDGLTPFRRLKGRDWQVSLPPWGEAVDYRVRTKHKLEARWATGIFCGVRLNTTEKIIATEDGIVVAQSVRRKPKEHRWDAALFGKVKGTPWAPVPGRAARPEDADELAEAICVQPELPEEPAAEAVAAEKKEFLKRVYIRQTDLDKHGYTAACPACSLIRVGASREGVARSEPCRAHIVGHLEKSEEGLRSQRQQNPVLSMELLRSVNPWKRPLEQEEEMVTNFLLSLREGFLNSVQGEPYPVCEEHLETEQFEEFETWNDISGKPLRPDLVRAARQEEVATINEMGVWEVIPRPKDEKVISTRWVDVNKRDEKCPKYRSRLVARELKKRYRGSVSSDPHTPSWEDFYASMPPISAFRTLFALATTRRVPDLDSRMQELPRNQCLVFLDIKKAHFWADARRRLLVELPEESGVDTEKYVRLLRKSLYGTRDAPANWEATICRVMTSLGFIQGIELEADPRHAELILREMGCEGAKVTTALVKERVDQVDDAEPLDRPDLQVLAKELAKGLKIALGKTPTAEMLADILTKPMEQARTKLLLERMNYHFMDGKHHLAI